MKFELPNMNYPIWDIKDFDLSELSEEELTNPNFYEPSYKERRMYKKGSSKIMDRLLESGPTVSDYLDIFYNENNSHLFSHHWPISRENFERSLNISYSIFCDPPSFTMTNHIDNRIEVALSIINLRDNECSTVFHKESMKPMVIKEDYGILHEGPKTRGSGVMFLNVEDTPHSITHSGDNLRYCLFNYLTLVL